MFKLGAARGAGLIDGGIFQASNGGLVMVNFYSEFITCGQNATLNDVIGEMMAGIRPRHVSTVRKMYCCKQATMVGSAGLVQVDDVTDFCIYYNQTVLLSASSNRCAVSLGELFALRYIYS